MRGKVRPEKKEMEVCEEEREWRTEGGRKEVGLAGAMERVEQRTRSRPSGREEEEQREMQRDGKSGRESQRGERVGWIFSLWLSGAYPPLEKTSSLSLLPSILV